MNLTIPELKDHNVRLIAIAGEYVDGNISDIQHLITPSNVKYKVHDLYKFRKDETFPQALMLLATGQNVKPEKIWQKYRKSEYLYFFIVERDGVNL